MSRKEATGSPTGAPEGAPGSSSESWPEKAEAALKAGRKTAGNAAAANGVDSGTGSSAQSGFRMNKRMVLFVAKVADGMAPPAAARAVGYYDGRRAAARLLDHPGVRIIFAEALAAAGVTPEKVAATLAEQIEATSTDRSGKEVPDNRARNQALEMAMRALGLFPDIPVPRADSKDRQENSGKKNSSSGGKPNGSHSLTGPELLSALEQRQNH